VILADAPLWCIAILSLLLVAAAVEDSIRLRIANRTNGAILVLGVATIAVMGPVVAVWQNVAVLVALLALGTMAFAAGKLGGGDVKLLAASGLWFPLMPALQMVLAVLLAGGLLALAILAARALRRRDEPSRILFLNRGSGIPYGVAIAIGVLAAIALQRGDLREKASDPFAMPVIAAPAS
jgi:prepilin peptidase CpaA